MQLFLTSPFVPHAYTILGAGVVAFFFLRGSMRGIFKELFSITCLVASYPLAKPFGDMLKLLITLEKIPAMFHTTVFITFGGIVAYGTLWVLFLFITRLFHLERKRYGWDRVLVAGTGACVGGAFGSLIVLITSWFILLMSSIVSALPTPPAEAAGSIYLLPSAIVRGHGDAFRASALGVFAQNTNPLLQTFDVGISIATHVSSNPESLQKLAEYKPIADMMEQSAVQNLLTNADIKAMAEEGNMIGIMNHPAVQEMLKNQDIQKMLQEINPEELRALLENK